MEMEFMAEFTEGMSHDRALQINKRKRTKRCQRPSSPFADGYCLIDNSNSTPDHSPAISSEISTSTEEDEDMANCLILLAQSVSPVTEVKYSDQIHPQKTEKLSSRRLTEMAAVTAGRTTDSCAYECKTCNRTFPTFQALGGHRASHKKPKVSVEEKKSNSMNMNIPAPLTKYSDEDRDEKKSVVEDKVIKTSLIISRNVETGNSSSKGKVHECSICGSEFTSGQALGGHMRKHRPIPPSVNRTESMINMDGSTNDQIIERSPDDSSNMFSLDLNFPPPEVADDVESKFEFTSNSSQHLIISTTALVDCHY